MVILVVKSVLTFMATAILAVHADRDRAFLTTR